MVSIDVSTVSRRTVKADTASPSEEYSPIFVQYVVLVGNVPAGTVCFAEYNLP